MSTLISHSGQDPYLPACAATYPRNVGTQSDGRVIVGSTHPQVSFTPAAVDQLKALPRSQVAAVAQTIEAMHPGAGTLLQITPPSMPTAHYFAIEPRDPEAPIVIYRERSYGEGDGYLVTALADRHTYATYLKAEQDGLTRTPLWKVVSGEADLRATSNLKAATTEPLLDPGASDQDPGPSGRP